MGKTAPVPTGWSPTLRKLARLNRKLVGGLTTIASFGQALAQGTGCGHCLQRSWMTSPLPQFPCPCCPLETAFGPKLRFRLTLILETDGDALPSLNSVQA